MDLTFLSQNIAALRLLEPSIKQLGTRPSKFKRWLRSTDKYVYARVPKVQRVVTPGGNQINRLRLQLFLSDKQPEELIKNALRNDNAYLFSRKPDLVITTFKTSTSPKSKEIELNDSDDFFLYCYYASKYAKIFENQLPCIASIYLKQK